MRKTFNLVGVNTQGILTPFTEAATFLQRRYSYLSLLKCPNFKLFSGIMPVEPTIS